MNEPGSARKCNVVYACRDVRGTNLVLTHEKGLQMTAPVAKSKRQRNILHLAVFLSIPVIGNVHVMIKFNFHIVKLLYNCNPSCKVEDLDMIKF